jgi:RNA polymerase sigma-70 factor, ECF subfamily
LYSDVTNIFDFSLIFSRYKVSIYNYVIKMVSDRMTAEDIVQNTFLKLYENLNRIHHKESINFWLFRTARNEIYGWYRKKKSFQKVFDPSDLEDLQVDSGYDLPEQIEVEEISRLLKSELALLPENQKEVFILKEYGGLSYKEIAEIMDTDENLVKSRLFKVRQKLTEKLSKKIL